MPLRWVRINYFFVLNCKGQPFSYFREKLPSFLFNYYKSMSPNKHYSHFKMIHNFPLISFYPCHPHSHFFNSPTALLQHPIIKTKVFWVFSLLKLYKFFIIIFNTNTSVFFSYTINRILINILKVLRGKFSQMRW